MAMNMRRKKNQDTGENLKLVNQLALEVQKFQKVVADHRKDVVHLSEQQVKMGQDMKTLSSSVGELKNSPTASLVEKHSKTLADMEPWLKNLDTQLNVLKNTTVGTEEYNAAVKQTVAVITKVAEAAAQLPVAIQNQKQSLTSGAAEIAKSLTSLGTLVQAVLEASEGPMSLSDSAVERLTDCIEKRLKPMVDQRLKTTMNQSFSRYEDSFQSMIDDGVERLAQERERLDVSIQEAAKTADLIDKRLKAGAVNVAGLLLFAATLCLAVVVVFGVFGMTISVFGLDLALPEIWQRTHDAESWKGHLGWGLLGVAVLAGLFGAIWFVAKWIWEHTDWGVRSDN